jgi:hypothetical protein
MTAVDDYLTGLPEERGEVLRTVLGVLDDAVPPGYERGIHYGMIGWVVPLATYPVTYNKQPLSYLALAAQKRYNALYLSLPGGDEADAAFRAAWARSGRTLDMGKSCLRFRAVDDLDLPLIADTVASVPVDDFIAHYERSRA